MVQFNFFRREVNCKIVYYGPGLSGKTTNLEVVHQKTPPTNRGELTSIATEQDRTLFFDFMPIDLGTVAGMKTKLRLFTVPGQVFYNSTRKLVLQGADGIIFVADSQKNKIQENLESLRNLDENLKEHGMDIRELPIVLQWNKRDMPSALTVEELDREVNYIGAPTYQAVAVTGQGVFPTLKKCAALVLESVAKKANEANRGFPLGGSKISGKGPGLQAKGPSLPPAKGAAKGGAGYQTPRPSITPPRIQKGSVPTSPTAPPPAATTAPSQSRNIPVFTRTSSVPKSKPIFKKFKKFLDKDKGGTVNR